MTRTLDGHAKAYLLIAKHSCFLDNTSSSRQGPDLIYMFSEAKHHTSATLVLICTVSSTQ